MSSMNTSEERRAQREAWRTVEHPHAESRLMAGMIRALGSDLYATNKRRTAREHPEAAAPDEGRDTAGDAS